MNEEKKRNNLDEKWVQSEVKHRDIEKRISK